MELVTEMFVESMMIGVVKLPSAVVPPAQKHYTTRTLIHTVSARGPSPTVATLLVGWPANHWLPMSSRLVALRPLGLDPPEGFYGRDDLGPLGPLRRATELPGGQMPVEMWNVAYGFATAGKVHKPSEQ